MIPIYLHNIYVCNVHICIDKRVHMTYALVKCGYAFFDALSERDSISFQRVMSMRIYIIFSPFIYATILYE